MLSHLRGKKCQKELRKQMDHSAEMNTDMQKGSKRKEFPSSGPRCLETDSEPGTGTPWSTTCSCHPQGSDKTINGIQYDTIPKIATTSLQFPLWHEDGRCVGCWRWASAFSIPGVSIRYEEQFQTRKWVRVQGIPRPCYLCEKSKSQRNGGNGCSPAVRYHFNPTPKDSEFAKLGLLGLLEPTDLDHL